MITVSDVVLLLSEAIIVFLGAVVVVVSSSAYGREKSKSLLAMSIGFAIIVAGSMIEEVSLELFHYPLLEAHILENVAEAAGFLFLVYSIYGLRD
jgi:hypothetical protein